MADRDLQAFVDAVRVDPAILELRPDYRVGLLAVAGVSPSAGNDDSERLLLDAEASARDRLERTPVEELAHVAAWRDAYRAFGAKPQRTRSSVEALVRRAEAGLPRINRLTDIYNAISVLHLVPIGGEDLDKYRGFARLVRSDGTETFETNSNGEVATESPEVGEVIWRDDAGVTCRRWNWRQGVATAISEETTSVFFIVDALDPLSDGELESVLDELQKHVTRDQPSATVARRTVGAG